MLEILWCASMKHQPIAETAVFTYHSEKIKTDHNRGKPMQIFMCKTISQK